MGKAGGLTPMHNQTRINIKANTLPVKNLQQPLIERIEPVTQSKELS